MRRTWIFIEWEKVSEQIFGGQTEFLQIKFFPDSSRVCVRLVSCDNDYWNRGSRFRSFGFVNQCFDNFERFWCWSRGDQSFLPCRSRTGFGMCNSSSGFDRKTLEFLNNIVDWRGHVIAGGGGGTVRTNLTLVWLWLDQSPDSYRYYQMPFAPYIPRNSQQLCSVSRYKHGESLVWCAQRLLTNVTRKRRGKFKRTYTTMLNACSLLVIMGTVESFHWLFHAQ